jgi:hypothetical protein
MRKKTNTYQVVNPIAEVEMKKKENRKTNRKFEKEKKAGF